MKTINFSLRNVALIWGILSAAATAPVSATDLVILGLEGRNYTIYNDPQPVSFVLRNDNILTADKYTSFVSIEDLTGNTVFSTEVEGSDLPPFTDETVTTPVNWHPEVTGKYKLTVGVDFAFDIDTSNNSFSTDLYAIIEYNEAAEVLVNFLPEVGNCDPNTAAAFMPHEPLGPGDTVTNVNDIEPYTVSLSLNNYKWFAYLDCDPGAKYAHPGAFITIDGVDASVSYANVNTWAQINGVDYMGDPWIRLDTEDQVYGSTLTEDNVETFSTIREEVSTPPPPPPPGKTCAILVSGKIRKAWERAAFNFDLDLMEGNLTREQLGLRVNPNNVERIGNATAGEICDAIERAKTGYDKIIFYYSGHGNRGWLVTNDAISEQLFYFDLARKLFDTSAKDICVIIDACYAGSAERRFRDAFKFPEKNVTLVMASMSTKTSLARVIQETASGERVWAGFFTWHFAQCYGDPAAESDGQTGISFSEAFHWVRQVNPEIDGSTINQRQNPQIVESQAR